MVRFTGLTGRADERAELEALLAELTAGRGRALVLHGGPGVGKTALVDAIAREADATVTVLRAAGSPGEAELAFAGLSDLLRPLADQIPGLPGVQATALSSALALAPPQPVDRLGLCVATLGLLRAAGRRRAVLLLVDDLGWLDTASRACVLFAARRAGGAVAVVLASRGPGSEHGSLPGLPVGPLRPAASLELLAGAAPGLAAPVAAAVVDAAAGLPLALIELPTMLSRGQREGTAALPKPLRPGRRLLGAFGGGVGELGAAGRRALLVAALYDGEDLATIAAACTAAQVDVELLLAAEGLGLVRAEAGLLVFAHPLLRGVVRELARPGERRRVHHALAEVLDGEPRTWHLAAATVAPDERVARELERAAASATARRSFSSASVALQRAAELSPQRGTAAERLLAAGKSAAAAGLPDRALALLTDASHAAGEGRLRVEAERLRGLTLLWNGRTGPARALLAEEAERTVGHDRVLAATMLADAAAGATTVDNYEAEALAERAAVVLGDGGDARARAHVLTVLAWVLLQRGSTARARIVLEEARRMAVGLDPLAPGCRWHRLMPQAALSLGEFERAEAESLVVCARARSAHDHVALSGALVVVAEAAYRRGDWSAADAAAGEAIARAAETGQPIWHGYALATRTRLLAARGREREGRAAIATSRALAEVAQLGIGLLFVHGAVGFLELGVGRVEEATVALEIVERRVGEAGLEEPMFVPWAADLIEAHLRAGREGPARRVLATLQRQVPDADVAPAAAVLARCQGMVDEDFEREFATALACDDRRPMPFERARTLLALGRRLHRGRRRAEARDRLREAAAGFEALGAAAWTAQARNELRAAGGRARAAPAGGLTPQEHRVALAVRRGASNREIAAELFLSPKTIESHLHQIHRKLGAHSRPQLVALLARRTAAEPSADAP